ncbi:MAG: phenazine biosynthesis protein PhzF [Rhodospirillales bacterium 20-60-12]|nr:MAG: phenazine biosynthesis protein PhzF [Rhodospirillales bacterium 20-60-12]HQT66637.1 PhzF family phenazine biosynthesis protein [Acetobacteraceae bacterium]
MLPFSQVDVFSSLPFKGNPLAVIHQADHLTDPQMRAIANWTNLSETCFLLTPTDPQADYRVRIFTPDDELPFAGHPTLGSCHAWLAAGGQQKASDIIQQCDAGLVKIRPSSGRLAFAAPPLRRTGPVEPALLARIATGLSIAPHSILAAQWIDNGPGWVAIMLGTRDELLALSPGHPALDQINLGLIAPWTGSAAAADFEVRAFITGAGSREDPVTGSLNAGLAQWLIGAGIAPATYTASQGTALGRQGRVHVSQSGADIWVGGHVVTRIEGQITL